MLVWVSESGGMWAYDLVEAYSNNVNGTDEVGSLHVGDDRWGRILDTWATTDGVGSLHVGDDGWRYPCTWATTDGGILARGRRRMAGSLTHGREGIQWGPYPAFCGGGRL